MESVIFLTPREAFGAEHGYVMLVLVHWTRSNSGLAGPYLLVLWKPDFFGLLF